MTVEEKILVATFLASCDVKDTPLGVFLKPEDLIAEEAAEVWSYGFIMKHDETEFCIIPSKSGNKIKLISVTMNQHCELESADWIPTDEQLAKALKESNFKATNVTPGSIKKITLTRWSK